MKDNNTLKFLKETLVFVYSKGFFHVLGANAILIVFGFVSQLFVAWVLTPEDLGIIKILQTYGSIFVVLGGLGYNVSVLKLCSEKRADGEKKYLYRKGIEYTLLGSLLSYGLIVFMALYGTFSNYDKINELMIVFGLSILPQIMSGVYFSYLQALKRMQVYSKIQVLTKAVSIAVVVVMTFYLGINGYVYALIMGYLITSVALIWHVDFLNKKIEVVRVTNPFKLHNKYSFISLIANVTAVISSSLDLLLINYFIDDRLEVGYYSFALTFVSLMQIFSASIMQVTNPYFSEVSSDFVNWHSKVVKYNRLMFITSSIVFAGSIIFVPFFLSLAFDGKYENSTIYFIFLSVGWFFRNLIVVKASALFGLGRIKANTLVGIVSIPIYFLFIVTGIYLYGLIGAAMGVIVSSIIVLLINKIVFSRIVNEVKNDEAFSFNDL